MSLRKDVGRNVMGTPLCVYIHMLKTLKDNEVQKIRRALCLDEEQFALRMNNLVYLMACWNLYRDDETSVVLALYEKHILRRIAEEDAQEEEETCA